MRIIIERASASTCMFEDSFVTVSVICNWDIKRSPFKKVAGNLYYGDLIFHLTKSFFNLKMISDKREQEQRTAGAGDHYRIPQPPEAEYVDRGKSSVQKVLALSL